MLARGTLFLMVCAVALALLFMNSRGSFRNDPTAIAKVRSIGDGLPPGSDVKFRGVLVGRVSSVDVGATSHGAVVHMTLKPEHVAGIPAAVAVRIVPSNIFAQPSLELVEIGRPGSHTESLRNGAVIAEDTSREAVEIQTAINKAYDLLTAVDPAQLTLVLDAVAGAFDGQGKKLGRLLARGDNYLHALNQHSPAFERALREAAEAIEGVRVNSPQLLGTVKDALVPARTFAAKQAQVRALLSAGLRVADFAGPFLAQSKDRMITVLHGMRPVLGALGEDRQAIAGSFRQLGAFAAFARSLKSGPDGPVVNVDFALLGRTLSPYTAADCAVYAGTAGVGPMYGRNCPRGHGRLVARQSSVPGGTVGPVGGQAEQDLINDLVERLAAMDGTSLTAASTGDVATLLLGPILRGATVSSP
jgi:phospholipid/cholesterol/gamma-HCH transport system substrate-binding protein